MKKEVQFNYRCVIINDDIKQTDHFNTTGTIEINGNQEIWSFRHAQGMNVQLFFDDQGVSLKQGNSILHFKHGKRKECMYQTPYGNMALETEIESYIKTNQGLKLVYHLYERHACISKGYMMIRL